MEDFQNLKAQLTMTLRGLGITDSAVLSAMEKVPREDFVPTALRQHAYENASLPLPMDQTISQPYVVARMTSALALTGRARFGDWHRKRLSGGYPDVTVPPRLYGGTAASPACRGREQDPRPANFKHHLSARRWVTWLAGNSAL